MTKEYQNIRYTRIIRDKKTGAPKRVIEVKYKKVRRPRQITNTYTATDEELHELGMAPFGDTGKSIRTVNGDMTEGLAKTFNALTERNDMPDESDDLIVDYIKPPREFRRSFALELDETRRTTLHNWLHYTSVAIEDMLEIIKEIDEK